MAKKKGEKGWLKWGAAIIAVIFLTTLVYHQVKPLPEGVSRQSEPYLITDDQIDFLHDLTYQGEDNENGTYTVAYDEIQTDLQLESI